jgi:hypothetical protein
LIGIIGKVASLFLNPAGLARRFSAFYPQGWVHRRADSGSVTGGKHSRTGFSISSPVVQKRLPIQRSGITKWVSPHRLPWHGRIRLSRRTHRGGGPRPARKNGVPRRCAPAEWSRLQGRKHDASQPPDLYWVPSRIRSPVILKLRLKNAATSINSRRLFLQRKGRQSKVMVHLDTEPEGGGNPECTPEQDGSLCRDRALSPNDFRNPHRAAAHTTRQFAQRKVHGNKEFIAQDFSWRVESRAEWDAVLFHIQ